MLRVWISNIQADSKLLSQHISVDKSSMVDALGVHPSECVIPVSELPEMENPWKSGWWFGTFVIFPYIGNNHPNWLIFFRGVQTTNQKWMIDWVIFFRWHGMSHRGYKPGPTHVNYPHRWQRWTTSKDGCLGVSRCSSCWCGGFWYPSSWLV